jgi:type IV pilus assembly protein PilB
MSQICLSKSISSSVVDYLVRRERLDPAIVEEAKADSSANDECLAGVLIQKSALTQDDLADVLGELYGLKRVGLKRAGDIEPDAFASLDIAFIREHCIVPFAMSDTVMKVAIADPAHLSSMGNVRLLVGKNIETYITTFDEIESAVESAKTASFQNLGSPSDQADEDEPEEASEVVGFVRGLLTRAVEMSASDIHVERFREFSRIRFRLDGVLSEQTEALISGYSGSSESSFLHENYRAITARLKIMSNLDISERRLPQDGAIMFRTRKKTVDMRVSVLPTNHGERIVLRLLDKSSVNMSLDALGFDSKSLMQIKAAVDAPQGMVLVTGPTGSGKTTTQYAALNRLNKPEVNILTVEDPVEYNLDGVSQVQVKDDIGLSFSAALRSFLRQDPEIVLVGEIRDRDTVDIAIKAALTGHLVLSTLHTNDAVSTITRLINMDIEPYLIASSISLIVAQRLARRICPSCKTIDESVTESHLTSIGFSAEEASRAKVYHGLGCNACDGRGVKGRRGIYEVLKITPEIQEAILRNESTSEIYRLAKSSGFVTMKETARNMMREGEIDFAEFNRVMVI